MISDLSHASEGRGEFRNSSRHSFQIELPNQDANIVRLQIIICSEYKYVACEVSAQFIFCILFSISSVHNN